MSDDGLSRRQRYALLRRQGYSMAKAADKAGYAGKAPPKARRLATQIDEVASEAPKAMKLRQKAAKLQFELEQAKIKIEALEALEAEKEG